MANLMSNLPIDVVHGTSPPKFRWLGPNDRTPMEGSLPSSMEARVVELIKYAKELELQLKTVRVHSAEESLKSELYAATARIRELEAELGEQVANSTTDSTKAEQSTRSKRGRS